jgi:hypothetical protein
MKNNTLHTRTIPRSLRPLNQHLMIQTRIIRRPDPHAILAQDLALLVPNQPHRAADKHGQQIGDIERVDDGTHGARSRAACLLVRLRGEGDGDEDGEEGHFACEEQRGEAAVDVVVGQVFGWFQDVLAREDVDEELGRRVRGVFCRVWGARGGTLRFG